MPVKKSKKKGKGKGKGKGKKGGKKGSASEKKATGIPDDIIKLEYPVPSPLPTGESLLKLLTTHDVKEKELFNQKLTVKILEQLSPAEIKDLKLVFDTFDANSDGFLMSVELRNALRVLGFVLTKERCKEIALSTARAGFVSLMDFLTLVIELQGEARDDLEEILKGFDYLDIDGQTTIGVKDIKRACAETGLQLSHQEIVDMIEEADYNGDGVVDRGEFVRIIRKTNLY